MSLEEKAPPDVLKKGVTLFLTEQYQHMSTPSSANAKDSKKDLLDESKSPTPIDEREEEDSLLADSMKSWNATKKVGRTRYRT